MCSHSKIHVFIKKRQMNKPMQESVRHHYAVLSRKYIFPCALTVYLVYLLIEYWGYTSIQSQRLYLLLNETFLLLVVIVSGMFAVCGQQTNDNSISVNAKSKLSQNYVFRITRVLISLCVMYSMYYATLDLDLAGLLVTVLVWLLVILSPAVNEV